jgi:hypothetical protein
VVVFGVAVFFTIFKGLLEADAANKLGTPSAAGLGFHRFGLVGAIGHHASGIMNNHRRNCKYSCA